MTSQSHVNPWMNGFFIATEATDAQKPVKANKKDIERRHAIENHQERMDAKKQLAEWGVL